MVSFLLLDIGTSACVLGICFVTVSSLYPWLVDQVHRRAYLDTCEVIINSLSSSNGVGR